MRKALLGWAFAVLAFLVGYIATDWFFRFKKIPYPFEFFGVLTGLALASWTAAIFSAVRCPDGASTGSK